MKEQRTDRPRVRFVVTVDTEADDAWKKPASIQLTNIAQLPRFQDLCDQYGIVPSYLLTYECVSRDEALSILLNLSHERKCEIGHHLHVWTTPPFENSQRDGVDHNWIHAFQFQLPDSLFTEKAECLREEIERKFGHSPTAHRAGRWGIDQRTIDWLIESNFIVDTSMRPWIRLYEDGAPVVSTKNGISCLAYDRNINPYLWTDSSNSDVNRSIVEIPATINTPRGWAANLLRSYLASDLPGELLILKIYRRVGGQRMLRPDPTYEPGFLPQLIQRAIAQGSTVINLMLHSSELALGCSPFTKNSEDYDRIWKQLEEAFRFIHRKGIVCDGISKVAGSARRFLQTA